MASCCNKDYVKNLLFGEAIYFQWKQWYFHFWSGSIEYKSLVRSRLNLDIVSMVAEDLDIDLDIALHRLLQKIYI